jgi:hypothetical protein
LLQNGHRQKQDHGKKNIEKTARIEKMKSTDFVVARDDLQQCKFIETQLPDAATLPDDALLIKIDRFAFTANNITYAVLGDQLKYWQLFPAPENFGNIPVWGFGEVIASRHSGISEGERLFGYFPMATHLVIEAADVSKRACATPPRIARAWRRSTTPICASAAIPPSPDARAIIRRCCGHCSRCRFWSTIIWPRMSFTARGASCSPAPPARPRSASRISCTRCARMSG